MGCATWSMRCVKRFTSSCIWRSPSAWRCRTSASARWRALGLMQENRRLTEENNRLTEDNSQKEAKIQWLTSKLEKLQKKLPDTEKQLWDTKQQLVQLEHKYRLLQGKLPAIAAGVVSADELQEEQL